MKKEKTLGYPLWWFKGVKVPYNSHLRRLLESAALQRGDAVFEAMYAKYGSFHGEIFHFQDHMERLSQSLKIRCFSWPYNGNRARVERDICIVSRLNAVFGYTEQLVYVYISPKADGLEIGEGTEDLVVIVKPYKTPDPNLYQTGVAVLLLEYERLMPNIKSTGQYWYARMAYQDAKKQGISVYDVVFQNRHRNITESAKHNVFVVKDGEVITSPVSSILCGVTRKIVLELTRFLNLPLIERDPTNFLFLNADEVFLTSTTDGVMPVTRIRSALPDDSGGFDVSFMNVVGDGKVGPVTKKLVEAFFNYKAKCFAE